MPDHVELKERLRACPDLPSSPAVAKRLIQLMESPFPDVEEIVQVLSSDSALTAKILQLANSSFFQYKCQITTLHKAAILIGFNGILATALSFTLVRHFQTAGSTGLDLDLFWRRSLLVASACRAIGEVSGRKDTEELFLAGLTQDIGMLALDRLNPDLYYSESLNQSRHVDVVAHEQEMLGASHAQAGSWLLSVWNFPSKICMAVQLSDEPLLPYSEGPEKFSNCVGFAVILVGLIITQASDETFLAQVDLAESCLGIDPFAFAQILRKLKDTVPESEKLFEMDSHSEANLLQMMKQARTVLSRRHVPLANQFDALFLQNAMPGAG